ncbi:DNA polymerase beta superfamily protein [Pseudomonas aeruginosa]|uniref:DNA polymerase beta superfamily protein n=1 Tax=Pseudomonas aeruginosa TaxID=287 RepID=UPI003906CC21
MIERPLSDELDISGWAAQALRLMRKSNPACWSGSARRWCIGKSLACARNCSGWAALRTRQSPSLPVDGTQELPGLPEGRQRPAEEIPTLRPLFAVRWLDAGLGCRRWRSRG